MVAEYLSFLSEGSAMFGGVIVVLYLFAALVGRYS